MNLNQVTIYSKFPVETVEFFEKLGLRRIVDSLPQYVRLECPDGEATLSVHIDEKGSSNNGLTLYFECEDLDEKISELQTLGLTFDEGATDREWLWREAYISDPNNNKICLFYAGENRKNPPWRVE